MSWQEHHTQSEQYASLAEVAKREGELERSQELYRLAAECEAHALEALDITKTRTLGITVVSAVALWFKAEELGTAERLAYRWLATDSLPSFAVQELRDLLQAIWQKLQVSVTL
jgi:hypothetical protein